MKKICLFLAAMFLLLSCSTSTTTPTSTALVIPTAETPNPLPEPTDPTQVIVVRPNETFDIVLSSNPSTGYRWQIIGTLDANFLESTGQTFIAEQPVMPGSGGVDIWTFRAITPVEGTIQFGYYPPGNDSQPEETVIFAIRIE